MPLPTSLAFSTVVPGPSGPSVNARTLSFVIQTQHATEWCWAAVAASIADYFARQPVWQQCCVVAQTFSKSGPPPCTAPSSVVWNRPSKLGPALDLVGHKGQVNGWSYAFSAIQNEIDNGRPLGVAIRWRASKKPDTHFLTLTGYKDDGIQPEVTVQDPFKGTTRGVPLSGFASQYRTGGTWTYSYETRP